MFERGLVLAACFSVILALAAAQVPSTSDTPGGSSAPSPASTSDTTIKNEKDPKETRMLNNPAFIRPLMQPNGPAAGPNAYGPYPPYGLPGPYSGPSGPMGHPNGFANPYAMPNPYSPNVPNGAFGTYPKMPSPGNGTKTMTNSCSGLDQHTSQMLLHLLFLQHMEQMRCRHMQPCPCQTCGMSQGMPPPPPHGVPQPMPQNTGLPQGQVVPQMIPQVMSSGINQGVNPGIGQGMHGVSGGMQAGQGLSHMMSPAVNTGMQATQGNQAVPQNMPQAVSPGMQGPPNMPPIMHQGMHGMNGMNQVMQYK